MRRYGCCSRPAHLFQGVAGFISMRGIGHRGLDKQQGLRPEISTISESNKTIAHAFASETRCYRRVRKVHEHAPSRSQGPFQAHKRNIAINIPSASAYQSSQYSSAQFRQGRSTCQDEGNRRFQSHSSQSQLPNASKNGKQNLLLPTRLAPPWSIARPHELWILLSPATTSA